jgi:hypothetical protein
MAICSSLHKTDCSFLFLGMHLLRRQDLSRRLSPMDLSGEKPPIIDELPTYVARSGSALEFELFYGEENGNRILDHRSIYFTLDLLCIKHLIFAAVLP